MVKVIPTSSGVSSSSEMNGFSWTSSPMQWPVRWRNQSPRPASTITWRVAALTAEAGTPGRTERIPAACASMTTS